MRKVACIKRKDIPNKYLQDGYSEKSNWRELEMKISNVLFLEKTLVENDETVKQIIPYTIIRNKESKIAFYQRVGNEQRLHGLWSAGFGGHIEDFEYAPNESLQQLIEKSLIRELKEEYSMNIDYNLTLEGIINEEQTKVGRTHFAIVFSVEVDDKLFVPSNEIPTVVWLSKDETKNYKKELWSEMAIELIYK